MIDIEFILNDVLNKALCLKGRIQNANSNKIAEFISDYLIKSKKTTLNKRYDKMVFKPPFRVGIKQGKAVLDSNGLLVTFFDKSEEQSLLFCDYLNSKF
tara:strand:- start:58 stop:354 length:297 start_codon:yes stop_codon:yes gene_type:complete